MKQKHNAFTLVELIIAVLIIGILSAVLIPNILGSRARSNNAAVQTFLKNFAQEQEIYYRTNGSYYPPGPTIDGTNTGAEVYYGRQQYVNNHLESAPNAATPAEGTGTKTTFDQTFSISIPKDITILIRTNIPDAHSGYCILGRWSSDDTKNHITYRTTPNAGVQEHQGNSTNCPTFN
jgi:prepilin-type N-terminal cleavage/methylation domain-containing protein